MKRVRAIVAIVVALTILNAAPIILGADTLPAPEKAPASPKIPDTGIDPGIQKDPGPSPDPHAAVPPKSNPDPGMAINPEASPRLRSQSDRGQKDQDKQAGTEKKTAESTTTSLKGQVLRIEPDSLTISTDGGGQARLKLDAQSKIQTPKVGDKVEVELTSDKQIVSLKIAQ